MTINNDYFSTILTFSLLGPSVTARVGPSCHAKKKATVSTKSNWNHKCNVCRAVFDIVTDLQHHLQVVHLRVNLK